MSASIPPATAPSAPRVRLFGQFLVEEGLIPRGELDEALTLMAATNTTLGELAVSRGLLTRTQADEINRLQHHIDGRWGELALTLQIGGLDAEGLEELCWEQHSSNLRLTDALVELGSLSPSQVEEQLQRFEDEQAATGPTDASLPPAYRDCAAVRAILDALPRLSGRLLRNPMRICAGQRWSPAQARAHSASASLLGAYALAVGLTVDEGLAATFATHLGTDDDPDATPALARFISRVCELVSRRVASETGLDARLGAPVLGQLPEQGIAFDLALGDGTATLILERVG